MSSDDEVYELNSRITQYNIGVQRFQQELDVVVGVLICEKDKKKADDRRSTHNMFARRKIEGAYSVLIANHLLDDDTKFQQYFRLTPYLFNYVLSKIEPYFDTHPTTWVPQPMTVNEKLCITLR